MTRGAKPAAPGPEDAQQAAFDAHVRADVERQGFHLGLVPAAEGTPGWAFTVGLGERFDHPELVAFGPQHEFVGGLVQALAERVRGGARFANGDQVDDALRDYPVELRSVAPHWVEVFLGNAAWYLGRRELPALQVFWPDRSGHFPWQPEFDPDWADDQPKLWHATVHEALSEAMIDVLRREGAL